MQAAFNDELKRSIEEKCAADNWYGLKNGKMKRGRVAKDYLLLAEQIEAQVGKAGKTTIAHLKKMAAYAKEVYRAQAKAEIDPDSLTDMRILDMCNAEPWTSARSVWDMQKGTGGAVYGYVTDRLGVAAELFPEGSAERVKYKAAFDDASGFYADQMRNLARAAVHRKLSDETSFELRAMLQGMAKIYEGEQTTRSIRLIDLAILIDTYNKGYEEEIDDEGSDKEARQERQRRAQLRSVTPDPDVASEFRRRKPSPNVGDEPTPL